MPGLEQEALIQELYAIVQRANLPINQTVCRQAIRYVLELERWNQRYNLTAVTDLKEMLKVHLLDSWAVLPYLPAGLILDLGSGAGLPGIPLALAAPDRSYVLLDARHKKVAFLEHIILTLKLTHVRALCTRVETYHPEPLFDAVVVRAVGPLGQLVELARGVCHPGGQIVAMKGHLSPEELQNIPDDFAITNVHEVRIPGWAVQRSVVCLKQKS